MLGKGTKMTGIEIVAFVTGVVSVGLLVGTAFSNWRQAYAKKQFDERQRVLRKLVAQAIESKLVKPGHTPTPELLLQLHRAIAQRKALCTNLVSPTSTSLTRLDGAIDCAACAARALGEDATCEHEEVVSLSEARDGFNEAYGDLPGIMEISEGDDCIKVIVRDRATFDEMPPVFAGLRVQSEMFIDGSWVR
jgi:hypothetical protein